MHRYLIIIPCYNEEKTMEGVISRAKEVISDASFLVVNDGSSDSTSMKAKNLGVKVIDLPFNLGYGAALQTGYKYAMMNNYDFAIQIDADGQHEIACIRNFIDAIESDISDIVVGSRFFKESVSYRINFIRKIGINLFSAIISLIIKQKITDPTSGFQALNRKAIGFYSQDIFPTDFPDADMLILSHFAGLRIKEIPVIMHKSPLGKRQMHSGLVSLYYVFKMFLSILVILLRERHRREV